MLSLRFSLCACLACAAFGFDCSPVDRNKNNYDRDASVDSCVVLEEVRRAVRRESGREGELGVVSLPEQMWDSVFLLMALSPGDRLGFEAGNIWTIDVSEFDSAAEALAKRWDCDDISP